MQRVLRPESGRRSRDPRRVRGILIAYLCVAACVLPITANARGSSAYLGRQMRGSNAVDAKGVRYYGKNYPGRLPPWLADRTRAIGPEYSLHDRRFRNQGAGLFRLSLDLKTGLVSEAAILRSTGFRTLDNSALFALRQWSWKPGKWKEIDMPVSFTMGSGSVMRPPPGAVLLPNASDR
jgi:TonB family protein